MAKQEPAEVVAIGGHEVRITHPDKPYFSREAKLTKARSRQVLSVHRARRAGRHSRPAYRAQALRQRGRGRGVLPETRARRPPGVAANGHALVSSGRTAEEVVVDDAAGLAWIVNLGCIELHPHPVRSGDLEHPDELRVDLDPGPGVAWADVRTVALEVKALLDEMGLRGWPKTSGSRGMHVNVRIHPRWSFTEVRRAARGAFARCRAARARPGQLEMVEGRAARRVSRLQPEREGSHHLLRLFGPAAPRRAGIHTSALGRGPRCEPADFTVLTVPKRFADDRRSARGHGLFPGSLEKLLELAAQDEAAGLGDAPWPPHFRRMEGEAPRVAPSRARSAGRKKPRTKMPLIVVANSPDKEAALAGLERWKNETSRGRELLAVDDVLVDSMRGRSSTWTRIRVNLRHVPEALRPAQETPDPDDDPTREWRSAHG